MHETAIADIRGIDQFYENPLHLASIIAGIRNAVKTGAGFVTRYGPAVMRGAQFVQDNL